MSKVMINDSTLTSIADAIRDVKGTTDTYKPAEMPQAILTLSDSQVAVSDDFIKRYMTRCLTLEDVNYILSSQVGEIHQPDKYYSYTVDSIPFYGFSNNRKRWNGTIIVPTGYKTIEEGAFYYAQFENIELPEGLETIESKAFYGVSANIYNQIVIPSTVQTIEDYAFTMCNFGSVKFKGTPNKIEYNAFNSFKGKNIYVPWSEGEVSNAPWGAPTSVTIHYDYTE